MAPEISRRESEVLALVGDSLTNAEIASRLILSERTVESHVSSLLRKFGVSSRRDLARMADRRGVPERHDGTHFPPVLDSVADASTFAGRRVELQVLHRQWEKARRGATAGVLVEGDAGIGKTRIVSEFAASLHRGGARVCLGSCHPDLDEPLGPLLQAIAADAARLSDEALLARGQAREVLSVLTPPLARALRLERSTRRAVPDREAVLDAVVAWFTASALEEPFLLVLEDLHWSSALTRDTVGQLLRSDAGPLLVVATTRIAAAERPTGFASFVDDVSRLPTVSAIQMSGLSVTEIGELVGAGAETSGRIHAETGGNPLLVRCSVQPGGAPGVSLTALLNGRELLLDDPTRVLLDAASVIGTTFDVEMLARLLGRDLAAVLASLEVACAAGLVLAPLEGAARFAFTHALFRDHRYEGLAWRRRVQLHAAVADVLEAGVDAEERVAERARHACMAVPVGSAATAVELATRAGVAAEAAHDYDAAAEHYRRAVTVAAAMAPSAPMKARDLAIRLAAVRHHGDATSGIDELAALAAEARDAGDDAALIRAATSLPQFGAPVDPGGPDRRVSDIVDAALHVLGDNDPRRPLLEVFRMQVRTFWEQPDMTLAIDIAQRAEAHARASGDPGVLADVLLHTIHCRSHPSQLEAYERTAAELERLGHETNRLAVRVIGTNALAAVKRCRGDLAGWRADTERVITDIGVRPVPFLQLLAIGARARQAFYDGDLASAEERAREMAPSAVAIGHGPAYWTGGIVLPVRRAQGEDVRLLPGLQRAVATRSGLTAWHGMLAAALARCGNVEGAQRVLGVARRADVRIPEEYAWALGLGELAEAAEVTGDPEVAGRVLEHLGPYADRLGIPGTAIERPIAQSLAQAALATGDLAVAEAHSLATIEWSRNAGTPVFLARSLVFLAAARQRAGASPAALRPLVTEALGLAARHGVQAAAVDIDRYALEF